MRAEGSEVAVASERPLVRCKRSFNTMVAAEYSKHGVIEGLMVTESCGVSCGVVCGGWPSWALAAKTRNWSIKIIVIKNNLWISEIRSLFPDACILEYTEFEPWLGLGLKVQVWFSDIDPPKKLSVFVPILSLL
jgi:hypothetical protein